MADALKKALSDKVQKVQYDREATRALLRHQQTADTASFDWGLVSSALLLARINQNIFENDFALFCCLIAESYHATPEMKFLFGLDDLLSTGKFQQVWPHLANLSEVGPAFKEFCTKNKAGIDASIIRSILVSLAVTFAEIETATVLAFTNVKSAAELAALPAAKGLVVKATDATVSFAKNGGNEPQPAGAPRTLTTDDVAALIKTIV